MVGWWGGGCWAATRCSVRSFFFQTPVESSSCVASSTGRRLSTRDSLSTPRDSAASLYLQPSAEELDICEEHAVNRRGARETFSRLTPIHCQSCRSQAIHRCSPTLHAGSREFIRFSMGTGPGFGAGPWV